MSTHTFSWPAGPKEVIVTGTFDNWSKQYHLVKQADGSFELEVPLQKVDEDRIAYKYVVDDEWTVSPTSAIEKDDAGIENNVLYHSELAAAAATVTRIPEAAGLNAVVPETAADAADGTKKVKKNKKKSKKKKKKSTSGTEESVSPTASPEPESASEPTFATTVLPSAENQQVTTGEPGVVIPQNAAQIKEFSEVSNVNAKDLNAQIEAEEAAAAAPGISTTVLPSSEHEQVTLGEPGVVIPENAAHIKEFSEISEVNAKDLNAQIEAEQAAEAATVPEHTTDIDALDAEPEAVATTGYKTLDPTEDVAAPAETPVVATEAPVDAAAESPVTESKASPVAAAKSELAQSKAKVAETVKSTKTDGKKKRSFFGKLKKLFS
ncbi:carbohydrate-binding module family 48 protein [Babjeviella inositovora NRRL Y-12698]|uniref:Carbohydrate-binding module family 48 protein n=1 Tax=Babjeviella inositovora NRRL Y-12698 TaxID=984486 RepID=A0A1E3QPM5_9ASCO|nr:carbohydrate-binding module family 48 protein [Babjeviella inositovora NRRL Y-12698]ODQ79656.1 carbohydrate-binding module family 48 protein [Babjeviella inositovora NRRL Y-12698]